MHGSPRADGKFCGGFRRTDLRCPGCGTEDVWCQEWESSDGAHEDELYACRSCGRSWWVDGPDA
jgi:uncharacterized Zn finger protein